MKKAIITRRIDGLGRLTIPMEMRKNLGIKPGERQTFEFIPHERGVLVVPYNITEPCHICGETEETFEFMGKHLCRTCAKYMLDELEAKRTK